MPLWLTTFFIRPIISYGLVVWTVPLKVILNIHTTPISTLHERDYYKELAKDQIMEIPSNEIEYKIVLGFEIF